MQIAILYYILTIVLDIYNQNFECSSNFLYYQSFDNLCYNSMFLLFITSCQLNIELIFNLMTIIIITAPPFIYQHIILLTLL